LLKPFLYFDACYKRKVVVKSGRKEAAKVNIQDSQGSQSAVVAGVFEQFPNARQAYLDLQAAGFVDEQIGVAQQNREAIDLKQSFLRLGMPEQQADIYDQQYHAGRIIVSVRPDGRDQEAATILQRNGAIADQNEDTQPTTMAPANNRIASDATSNTVERQKTGATEVGNAVQDDASGEQALRLREERLQIDKNKAQTGQVQIHKEIITEQKTITVPVTREEVVIEHRRVAPDSVGNVAAIGDDEIIRIPVSEEQVSVTKRPVVVEEVVVGKRQVQETRHVSETVRHEEPRLEQSGDVPIHDTTDRSDINRTDSVTNNPNQ
jgi:uncharacterized protein (TIGR02271 family)